MKIQKSLVLILFLLILNIAFGEQFLGINDTIEDVVQEVPLAYRDSLDIKTVTAESSGNDVLVALTAIAANFILPPAGHEYMFYFYFGDVVLLFLQPDGSFKTCVEPCPYKYTNVQRKGNIISFVYTGSKPDVGKKVYINSYYDLTKADVSEGSWGSAGGGIQCGNSKKEGSEVCDGSDLDGKLCTSFGYSGGTLKCKSDCSGFDFSQCTAGQKSVCGNGIIEEGEVCDGNNLGGKTCQTFGFNSGTLKCKSDCLDFDKTFCSNQQQDKCGNGIIDIGEDCDGSNLQGQTCQSKGFDEGTLLCTSCKFDTSLCKLKPKTCTGDIDCSDNNACTIESCINQNCVYDKIPDGTMCDDGLYCNGIDSCLNGVCSKGKEPNCDDNSKCTQDICNEEFKECTHIKNKACDLACVPNFQCTDWSKCTDGKQYRSCKELSGCADATWPELERSCAEEGCKPIGGRKAGFYCDFDSKWKEQKLTDLQCENNWECSSNVCVNNKCVEANLFHKFIEWIKKLFLIAKEPEISEPIKEEIKECQDNCDDGIGCTVDNCVEGNCENKPDNGLCAEGEVCELKEGCKKGEEKECLGGIAGGCAPEDEYSNEIILQFKQGLKSKNPDESVATIDNFLKENDLSGFEISEASPKKPVKEVIENLQIKKGRKFSQEQITKIEKLRDELDRTFFISFAEEDKNSVEKAFLSLIQHKDKLNLEYVMLAPKIIFYDFPNDPPNDPYFHSKGSWGQTFDDLWGIKRVKAHKAWNISLGNNAVVAVVDSGIDIEHSDIAENIWINVDEIPNNGIDDDKNGYIDDYKGWDSYYNKSKAIRDPVGHGTHVAGTIAAVGNNNKGVIGMAPKAKIMVVKAGSDEGGLKTQSLEQGLIYAANNGADVISNSWGCVLPCPSSPVIETAVKYGYGLGSFIVFAAGNKKGGGADVGINPISGYSPQNMDEEVFTIASIGVDNKRSSYSFYGKRVDVGAPGGDPDVPPPLFQPYDNILSLLAKGCIYGRTFPELIVGNEYMRAAGTSMAAPHVSGLAALIIGANNSLSNKEIGAFIINNAEYLKTDKPIGAGIIDAEATLNDIGGLGGMYIHNFKIDSYNKTSDILNIYGILKSKDVNSKILSFEWFNDEKQAYEPISFYVQNPPLNQISSIGYLYVPHSIKDQVLSFRVKAFVVERGEHTDNGYFELNRVKALITEPENGFISSGKRTLDIKGDALGPGDSRFEIKYRKKDEQKWQTEGITLMNNGKANITKELLAKFDTKNIKDDEYIIELSVISVNENESFSVNIIVDESVKEGFPVKIGIGDYGLIGALSVSDIDGDGAKEIIVAGADYQPYPDERKGVLYVINKSAGQSWTATFTNDIGWTGGLVSIYENPQTNKRNLIAGKYNMTYHFDAYGNLISKTEPGGEYTALSDIDNNKIMEIIASNKEVVEVRDINNKKVPWFESLIIPAFNEFVVSPPAVGDLDGDGFKDIVFSFSREECEWAECFGYQAAYIIALDMNGNMIPGFPVGPIPNKQSPLLGPISLADLNNDGKSEIIFITENSDPDAKGYVFRHDGSLYPGWPRDIPEGTFAGTPVAVGDLNKDGFLELVLSSREWLVVYDHNGNVLLNKKFEDFSNLYFINGFYPAIGNLDNDNELEILLNGDSKYVYAFNLDGSNVNGFPRVVKIYPWMPGLTPPAFTSYIWGSPVITDLEENGLTDIIVLISALPFSGSIFLHNYVYAWELNVTYDQNLVDWPEYGFDIENTFCFKCSQLKKQTDGYKFFVSSQEYDGNLGGTENADKICQNLADNAGLKGIWKAWLSDSSQPAKERLYRSPLIDFVNIKSEIISQDWKDLVDGAINKPINLDERGSIVTNVLVWTGTDEYGNAIESCNDWKSNSNLIFGNAGGTSYTNEKWTKLQSYSCNERRRIYCVEQPENCNPRNRNCPASKEQKGFSFTDAINDVREIIPQQYKNSLDIVSLNVSYSEIYMNVSVVFKGENGKILLPPPGGYYDYILRGRFCTPSTKVPCLASTELLSNGSVIANGLAIQPSIENNILKFVIPTYSFEFDSEVSFVSALTAARYYEADELKGTIRGEFCKGKPNGEQCDDGLFCNGKDKCMNEKCASIGQPPCLKDEICDELKDICLPPECRQNLDCNDNVTCTQDVCENNVCKFIPDNNLCQKGEKCIPMRGCVPDSQCPDDGISCTIEFYDKELSKCISLPYDNACGKGMFCNPFSNEKECLSIDFVVNDSENDVEKLVPEQYKSTMDILSIKFHYGNVSGKDLITAVYGLKGRESGNLMPPAKDYFSYTLDDNTKRGMWIFYPDLSVNCFGSYWCKNISLRGNKFYFQGESAAHKNGELVSAWTGFNSSLWISDHASGTVSSKCGNGVVEPGEQCDKEDLRGKTCKDFGYAGGTLKCFPPEHPNQCTFDLSECSKGDECIGKPDGTPCTDDGNICTKDICSKEQCTHPPEQNGKICNDNNLCTENDACYLGQCKGQPKQCPPGYSCDSKTGNCILLGECSGKPDGTQCTDDGNQCTQDICLNQLCSHPFKPEGSVCNDNNLCTENDKCSVGECKGQLKNCGIGFYCDNKTGNCVPLANEICDGIDNNNNNIVDEGCDDDNDNYCDKNMKRAEPYSCYNTPQCCPFGGNDCNDNNPLISPGQEEICGDKIDNNCNGYIDESCYLDSDGDGDPDIFDCAPFNPKIHHLAEEICDGLDNNCDDLIDIVNGTDICYGRCVIGDAKWSQNNIKSNSEIRLIVTGNNNCAKEKIYYDIYAININPIKTEQIYSIGLSAIHTLKYPPNMPLHKPSLRHFFISYPELNVSNNVTSNILLVKPDVAPCVINNLRQNITLLINNEKNLTKEFNETPVPIEFRIKEKSYLKTRMDCTLQKINLSNINITIQHDLQQGFTFIKNTNISEKDVYVDTLAKSNYICLIDEEEPELNITFVCKGKKLECPGTLNQYTCSISNNRYIVTNTSHTFIFELNASCGDGKCNGNENSANCPQDCGSPAGGSSSGGGGGGRGGGGGGGGGGAPPEGFNITSEWLELVVGLETQTKIIVNNNKHQFIAENFDNNKALVTFKSEPVKIELLTGKMKSVDITSDSKQDIDVLYIGKRVTKGIFQLRLSQPITKKEEIKPSPKEEIKEEKKPIIPIEEKIEDKKEEIAAEPRKNALLLFLIILGLPLLFVSTYFATKHMHHNILHWKYFDHVSKLRGEKVKLETSSQNIEELKSYITECLKWHYPKERIMNACLRVGWKKETIEYILKQIK